MPHIDHSALWVADLADALEASRGTRLELMTRPDVAALGTGKGLGRAHVSFKVDDRDQVDRLAASMAEAGVRVVDGPRETGDGYYEAAVLDPEGNTVEILVGDYSDEVALRPSC